MQNKYGSEKLAKNFMSENQNLPNLNKYSKDIKMQLKKDNENFS